MAPQKTGQRAVRILLLVGRLMMAPVDCYPSRRTALQATHAQDRQRVFEPFRAAEALMGQEAVITDVDTENAENEIAANRGGDAGPAEIGRNQSKRCNQVIKDNAIGKGPFDP